MLDISNFSIDDVVPYLNQELPGFEPSVLADAGTDIFQLRVKTNVRFAAYQSLSREAIYPLYPRSLELRQGIDKLIDTTRREMIQKLGLQKEIDAEVKRTIDRERREIEDRAYRKALDDAIKKVVRDLVPGPSLDAVMHFINGGSE